MNEFQKLYIALRYVTYLLVTVEATAIWYICCIRLFLFLLSVCYLVVFNNMVTKRCVHFASLDVCMLCGRYIQLLLFCIKIQVPVRSCYVHK